MSEHTNNETKFNDEVVANLPKSYPIGTGSVETKQYSVSVSKGLHDLADALWTGIHLRVHRDVLSLEDIEKMLTNLVRLRCLQVTRRLPSGIVTKDIVVPDFFFPFLAAISKVELSLCSMEFYPVYQRDGETIEESKSVEENTREERDAAKSLAEEVDKVARSLKAYGIRVTSGLPNVTFRTDDTILRIQETETGEFLVAGGAPAETDLLIRSVVRIGFKPEYFGEARTRYSRVDDYHDSLWRIVDTAYPAVS